MKLLATLLLITIMHADNEMYKIISTYRSEGIDNIKPTLEKYLLDKKYWESIVNSKDTRYGYYESVKYVFIASKENNNLLLFELDENKVSQIGNSSAIFGANKDDKIKEGDLATPIGVYDLTKKLKNLDQYYGPLAFVTSYPNLYDKLNKKTGYGIWIHGLPLNGDRSEKNTKGCIAIENNTLLQYEKIINHKDSVLITSNKQIEETSKEIFVNILQSLFIWRDAWINNDLNLYLSFYDDNFTRFDGMKINEFKNFKKKVFDKNERKIIEFKNINIIPYPNIQNKKIFRITFLENYKSDSGYTFLGNKELYIVINNNSFKIIIEK